MDIRKVDANTIEITKSQPVVHQYDYGFLKKQIVAIQLQKDQDNAQRDLEIAEVEAIIAEADKLGIIEKQGEASVDQRIARN